MSVILLCEPPYQSVMAVFQKRGDAVHLRYLQGYPSNTPLLRNEVETRYYSSAMLDDEVVIQFHPWMIGDQLPDEDVYLILFAGLLATVFFAAWMAMVKLTRFEQVTA